MSDGSIIRSPSNIAEAEGKLENLKGEIGGSACWIFELQWTLPWLSLVSGLDGPQINSVNTQIRFMEKDCINCSNLEKSACRHQLVSISQRYQVFSSNSR